MFNFESYLYLKLTLLEVNFYLIFNINFYFNNFDPLTFN